MSQDFSTNTTAKSATTSCQVQSSWWSDLVSICKCQDFVTDVDCQMKLVTITTSSATCKENANQNCRDYIFKLAYQYKSSPTSNTCQYDDPNYQIAQNLAKSCEDQ